MIDKVERYSFTLNANNVDLLQTWASKRGATPQEWLWCLLNLGATYAAARELGHGPPPFEQAMDPAYLAEDLLPALREDFSVAGRIDAMDEWQPPERSLF